MDYSDRALSDQPHHWRAVGNHGVLRTKSACEPSTIRPALILRESLVREIGHFRPILQTDMQEGIASKGNGSAMPPSEDNMGVHLQGKEAFIHDWRTRGMGDRLLHTPRPSCSRQYAVL